MPLYVYVLASRSRALYVGVTNDIGRRLAEHRAGLAEDTARYRIDRLVRLEEYPTARDAIEREKQLKGWRRSKRTALIETDNPTWRDLEGSRYGATSRAGAASRADRSVRLDAASRSRGGERSGGPRRGPSTPLRSAQDDGVGEMERNWSVVLSRPTPRATASTEATSTGATAKPSASRATTSTEATSKPPASTGLASRPNLYATDAPTHNVIPSLSRNLDATRHPSAAPTTSRSSATAQARTSSAMERDRTTTSRPDGVAIKTSPAATDPPSSRTAISRTTPS